ncbi:tol-pal system YbgF family protein [Roseivirga sp. BDSF3-8]|uniref:tetratricopeptide repeat protein n=1 Tax=Roseivirga sp. BDSF3-8 TaxID=3241598 RepID=UPI0035327B66
MLNDDATVRRIESYLEDTMEEKERQKFEKELLEDPELRDAHDQFVTLIGGIQYATRNEMYRKLQKLEAGLEDPELTGESKAGKRARVVSMWRKPWVASLAAAITLLFITTVVLLTGQRNVPGNELFAQSFSPYPNIVMATQRGGNEERNTLQKAFYAYDRENYDEAIGYFSQVPESEYDASVLLYMGNAYLASGKAQDAEDIFKNVIKNYEQFNVQAEWYLALSYLKQDRKAEARKMLQKLTMGQNSYREDAQLILRKL